MPSSPQHARSERWRGSGDWHGQYPGLHPDGRLCLCPLCWRARQCKACSGQRDITCGHCRACQYADHYYCNY